MTVRLTARTLIKRLNLHRHPEGGFFAETCRAGGKLTINGVERNFHTAIYFLLPRGQKSRLHRIKSDELWHFYAGGPLTVAQIRPDGGMERVLLGPDIGAGQKFQHVVPAGCWFGAYPEPGTDFALVGCTVAPGFDFDDLEFADRAALLKQYPHAKELIEQLTD